MDVTQITYRSARAADLDRCVDIRGMTRDNALDRGTLVYFGVTTENWAPKIDAQIYVGFVAEYGGEVVAYSFADIHAAEVQVLAVLPDFEGKGVGKTLLRMAMDALFAAGHTKIWLAAGNDSSLRSHGFYRHLGWRPTGELNEYDDEILEYTQD